MDDIPNPKNLPAVPDQSTGLKLLTDKELDKEAARAGLVNFKPATIRAFKKIGQHLDALGITHIQAARVVATSETLQRIVDNCVEICENGEAENEDRVKAASAAIAGCSEINRSSELIVKMVQDKMLGREDAPRKFRSFPAGEIPLMVNIKAEGPVTVESKP